MRLRALLTRWGVALAIFLAGEGLIYAYQWGQRGAPHLHWLWLMLGPVAIALLYYGAEQTIARYPNLTWLARLHMPRWSHLEPFFKKSRILIHIVVLSYVLFYVTQGVAKRSDWALWVNENIFHFVLFCRSFEAIEVMRIEIAGYALYLILQGIYSYYCPQILAHSMRREGGLPREDASLVFVDTIERHGAGIPATNLADTVADFARESAGALDDETRALIAARVALLMETAAGNEQGSQAVAGDAAGVARLFPFSQALQIYYVGRDLFDILYPAIRGILTVGVAVALVTTSLPVAAKLVWVMFPRLGETCMVDILQPPPGFRDSDWVEFEGKMESQTSTEVILIPAEDANERWHLAPADVTEIPVDGAKRYFLRRGGTVRDVKTTAPSTSPPAGVQSRMSFQCGTAGSRCSNHIEICCGTGQIVGNCYGRWSCPTP